MTQRDQQAAREAEQMDWQVEKADLLDEVLKASATVGAFGQERTAAIARRNVAIRTAFVRGASGPEIAKAAGLVRERIYQIIDGR